MSQWSRIKIKAPGWIGDIVFTLGAATVIALTLGVGFLNSSNWPTGGDSASHLLYAWLYAEELLFSGHITPWVPEVFGGLPFLSYYFPLPFIVIALLSKLIGIASAFKWGAFLAAMLLPGAVFVSSRHWLKLSWPAALFGALGALAFILHEQNSIWGGNLLSTLAGEFSYSYGILFAALSMMAWVRAVSLGRGWVLAGLMEAASGFSHGFPLLVIGFSTAFLLLDNRNFWRTFLLLLRGHLLAFCLLAGWLWPMLEMHSLTIPNDAAFGMTGWRDLLPAALWPSLGAGISGLVMLVLPSVRRGWGVEQARAVRFLLSGAGLAAMGFIAGDQLGLADIRFFPLVWLFGAIACGWLLGQALAILTTPGGLRSKNYVRSDSPRSPRPRSPRTDISLTLIRTFFAATATLSMLGWLGSNIQAAPDWALWNHAGLDAKPQWHILSKLFPAMRGDLWSPRLVFEHDPDNNDIGSTRTLEALPMFLNHRPVLEGLYMESALLGPAIYLLQSEVSQRPSSPLVRFPSASLDPHFAAQHMNSLHSDTLLLRSKGAQAAIEASGLFEKTMASAPFAVYKLKKFDSQLAQVVTQPLRVLPKHEWMQDSFAWFRTRSRFEAYQPIYSDSAPKYTQVLNAPPPAVRQIQLSRHKMVFETEAIGQPHLVKIAYHPRWHLLSKGTLSIAAPGYLLVIPEEKEIRLEYGHTVVGIVGIVASSSAILYVLFLAWQRVKSRRVRPVKSEIKGQKIQPEAHGGVLRWLPLLTAWGLLAAGGFYIARNAPEKIYNLGWDAMRANKFEEAGAYFNQAYKLRRPPSKKEEALFWSAKASEQGGKRDEAKARYRELAESYHGFWLPEALFTLIQLESQDGNGKSTEKYARVLREEYPSSHWAISLGSKSAEQFYEEAWDLMRANQYPQASELFVHAYQLRQSPAGKEEALFWLAKSSELAGKRAEAKMRYRELAESFSGYWLPESLYNLVLLENQDGKPSVAGKYARKLHNQFPDNSWTLKLDQIK